MSRRMKCPDHDFNLRRRQTRYGGRWYCPEKGCTVVCWEGSTSTPANKETRDARQLAHDAFDRIWKTKVMSRAAAYLWLADFLNIGPKCCHIGMFDAETCERVRSASIELLESEK